MKSSKIENIFSYTPPAEDTKTLSPFTYYQPFQSSFDPDFSVPPPKAPVRPGPPQPKRRGPGAAERASHLPPGGLLGLVDPPRPAFHLKAAFPEASTSAWGDPEPRSLCSSRWLGAPSPRPPFPGEQKPLASALEVPGAWAGQLPGKGGAGLGAPDGASLRAGGSVGAPSAQTAAFDGVLGHSTYYPLMLSPLAKNMTQNMYKTGHSRPMVCNFCKNNKEVPDIYLNHYLYDPETKVLSCPVLRKHVCEICGGTGDQAHTLQYCPVNRERGLQSKVPVLLKTRTITNSTGKIRRN